MPMMDGASPLGGCSASTYLRLAFRPFRQVLLGYIQPLILHMAAAEVLKLRLSMPPPLHRPSVNELYLHWLSRRCRDGGSHDFAGSKRPSPRCVQVCSSSGLLHLRAGRTLTLGLHVEPRAVVEMRRHQKAQPGEWVGQLELPRYR